MSSCALMGNYYMSAKIKNILKIMPGESKRHQIINCNKGYEMS